MDKIIGIYKITNPINQVYVGSSKNIHQRWNLHKFGSINRKNKIADSIKKYGHKDHLFEIIEECDESVLLERERYWQDNLKVCSPNNLNSNLSKNTVFINGKRQRTSSLNNKFYLDTNTGVYYYSAKEISELYSINICTLLNRIAGYRGAKNNTIWLKV